MATVLVTGGAGFLGSHLCDRLIERGDDVICLDNFFTGSKENIRHLLGHERFELVRHDIVHPFYLECDRIFNLACPASPEAYQFNRSRPSRHRLLVWSMSWGWPNVVVPEYYMRPRRKFMGTHKFIRKLKITGATLIRLDRAVATTKANASPNL